MINPKRAIADLKELRALTADEHGAQRIAWSDTWLRARAWFEAKLTSLPVEHHLDAAGNRWVTLPGESPKALLLGSHLDSVPNGGWLDGRLGEICGLEILCRFAAEFNGRPPHILRLPTLFANLYIAGAARSWALVDAGLPGFARSITRRVERRFGPGARPEAIILTH